MRNVHSRAHCSGTWRQESGPYLAAVRTRVSDDSPSLIGIKARRHSCLYQNIWVVNILSLQRSCHTIEDSYNIVQTLDHLK